MIPAATPTVGGDAACAAGGAPGSGAALTDLPGRWEACDGAFGTVPHAGVEVSGALRWRFLDKLPTGELVPAPDTPQNRGWLNAGGHAGQATLHRDPPSQGYYVMALGGVSGDTLSAGLVGAAGAPPALEVLARRAPSPDGGLDMHAPLGAGACSLVGTWDVTPGALFNPEPPRVMSFDEHGRWASTKTTGADLCEVPLEEVGTWGMDGGSFSLVTTANGGGPCGVGIRHEELLVAFSADCDTFKLVSYVTDDCTGAGSLYPGSLLSRRK